MKKYKERNNQTNTPEFKKWFGKSKIIDKSRKPQVVYHGTNTSFKSFEQNRIGSYTGNYGHYGYGFYFSEDPREAETYGKTILPVYIKMENPFYGNDISYLSKYAKEFGDYEKIDVAIDKGWFLSSLQKVDIKAFNLAKAIIDYGYDKGWSVFLKNNNAGDAIIDLNDIGDWAELTNVNRQEGLSDWDMEEIEKYLGKPKTLQGYDFSSTPQMKYMTDLGSSQAKDLTDKIKKDGYDGVIVGSEYVVFFPNQIKSAIGNNGNFDLRSNNILESKKRYTRLFEA